MKITIIALLSLILDQVIKFIITSNMIIADTIHIIKNFFRITYLQNTGGAFSILSGNVMFLVIVSIVLLGLIIFIISKDKNKNLLANITYGMLIGGILGNLIDRIRLGYVVDYLDFNFLSYNFPVFNLADIFIVISAILLIIKYMKEGE